MRAVGEAAVRKVQDACAGAREESLVVRGQHEGAARRGEGRQRVGQLRAPRGIENRPLIVDPGRTIRISSVRSRALSVRGSPNCGTIGPVPSPSTASAHEERK